jgi:hypothetical protein
MRRPTTRLGRQRDRPTDAPFRRRPEKSVGATAGLRTASEAWIESAALGEPSSPLRWVCRNQRHLVDALRDQSVDVSQPVVANLVRSVRKCGRYQDRDATSQRRSQPPGHLVDTKKKEPVGDPRDKREATRQDNGRELRPQGQPEPVRAHDLMDPEIEKLLPYGPTTPTLITAASASSS